MDRDEEKLEKADNLRKRLEDIIDWKDLDVLSVYRTWLDDRDIVAEGKDGFPTNEVYLEDNIKKFIEDWDCGYACEYEEPYGFVPEADCPIHDKKKKKNPFKD